MIGNRPPPPPHPPRLQCLDWSHQSRLMWRVTTERRLQRVGSKSWDTIAMGLSDCTLIKSVFENNIFTPFKLHWGMDWKLLHGLTTSWSPCPRVPSRASARWTLLSYQGFQDSFMWVPVKAGMRSHSHSFLHKYLHKIFTPEISHGIWWDKS